MEKKILSLTLAVCIALTLFAGMTFTANATIYSGSCGKNATWSYNTSTKALTISGSGAMTDYSETHIGSDGVTTAPWNKYYKDIKSIVVSSGIKTISRGAFLGCRAVTDISIANTVTTIAAGSFAACVSLKKFDMPNTVTSLPEDSIFEDCTGLTCVKISSSVSTLCSDAFSGCTALECVTIPKSVTVIKQDAFYKCNSLKNVYYTGTASQKGQIKYQTYPNSDYREDHKRILEAKWYCNSADCMHFPDVNYGDWYGMSVEYATYAGLMTGYSNGKFGTTDGIQRQDFVIILSRLSGDNLSVYKGQKAFKDVDPNAYYATALAWAKDKGVSSGYNDGNFGVGRKVTREQIVTFLYNYAKLKKYSTTVSATDKNQISAQYPDFKNVSSYAQEATYWALKKGVISGKQINGKKYIAPGANAQRCEVAAMFYNIDQKNIFKK